MSSSCAASSSAASALDPFPGSAARSSTWSRSSTSGCPGRARSKLCHALATIAAARSSASSRVASRRSEGKNGGGAHRAPSLVASTTRIRHERRQTRDGFCDSVTSEHREYPWGWFPSCRAPATRSAACGPRAIAAARRRRAPRPARPPRRGRRGCRPRLPIRLRPPPSRPRRTSAGRCPSTSTAADRGRSGDACNRVGGVLACADRHVPVREPDRSEARMRHDDQVADGMNALVAGHPERGASTESGSSRPPRRAQAGHRPPTRGRQHDICRKEPPL